MKNLIALAKANPGTLTYGTIGAGQIPYWGVMLFNSMAGIQATEVPYKATPDVIFDVIAGRVDYYITGRGSWLPVRNQVAKLFTLQTRAARYDGCRERGTKGACQAPSRLPGRRERIAPT